MGNRRRKDDAHDIGDSMPGTVGDSQGTIHYDRDIASFDPEDVTVPEETGESHNKATEETTVSRLREAHKEKSEKPNWPESAEQPKTRKEETGETSRMRSAEKYGDSWPEERQHRFLREHDLSAEDMGWKVTE